MATSRQRNVADYARWQQAQVRQAERDRRAEERRLGLLDREEKRRRIADRRAEAERMTADIARWVRTLQNLVAEGLNRPSKLDLHRFKRRYSPSTFTPGRLGTPAPRPPWADFEPAAPGRLAQMFGAGERHRVAVERARQRHAAADEQWKRREQQRLGQLAKAKAAFEARESHDRAEAERHNRLIDAELTALRERRRESVERYFEKSSPASLCRGVPPARRSGLQQITRTLSASITSASLRVRWRGRRPAAASS